MPAPARLSPVTAKNAWECRVPEPCIAGRLVNQAAIDSPFRGAFEKLVPSVLLLPEQAQDGLPPYQDCRIREYESDRAVLPPFSAQPELAGTGGSDS